MVEPKETIGVKNEEGEERKNGSKLNKEKNSRDLPELLRGVEFSLARNGPDMYLKAREKLELYTLTT